MYKPFLSLVTRYIAYTLLKSFGFNKSQNFLYKNVFNDLPSENYPMSVQLGIRYSSRFLAGAFCAIASHPFEIILEGKPIGLSRFLSTMLNRSLLIGRNTAFLWFFFDSAKTILLDYQDVKKKH